MDSENVHEDLEKNILRDLQESIVTLTSEGGGSPVSDGDDFMNKLLERIGKRKQEKRMREMQEDERVRKEEANKRASMFN